MGDWGSEVIATPSYHARALVNLASKTLYTYYTACTTARTPKQTFKLFKRLPIAAKYINQYAYYAYLFYYY